MSETDFREEMKAIRVPTLIVHGTADHSVPIHFARIAAQLVPGCRYLEYEGAPHGLPVTHKDRLNADLLQFVKL